jgi:hypothetical protein
MDTKLTLKLDKNVIEKAKVYAAKQKISISFIVENYLNAITSTEKSEEKDEVKISEFVKSISVGNGEIPVDFDYKKARQDHLIEKYK